MLKMKMNLFSAKSAVKIFCGQYPALFYTMYGLKPINRMLFVNQSTQLVIEGFPRSANTFAVLAFQYLQSKEIKIAHHLHVPSQIFRAVKWHIPTIVLIRNPIDAVASLLVRNPKLSITQSLKNYISFYERIREYRYSYIVASFDEVVQDYSQVIKKLNNKFDTNFYAKEISASAKKNIFNQIDKLSCYFVSGEESKAARPSVQKKELKQIIRQEIHQKKHQSLVVKSEYIFQEFTADKN
ncbi:hypothetical protein [Coleofasciculus sp. F4-SAH-05]|uniref:hypothetical protein n=1 Tax=Coleofasciculus sp. F4-SAH-05 TaxID=3069525 RepID=UPI0032F0C6C2